MRKRRKKVANNASDDVLAVTSPIIRQDSDKNIGFTASASARAHQLGAHVPLVLALFVCVILVPALPWHVLVQDATLVQRNQQVSA